MLEATENGEAGLFVGDDGSEAEIDSRRIVLRDNQEGATIDLFLGIGPYGLK